MTRQTVDVRANTQERETLPGQHRTHGELAQEYFHRSRIYGVKGTVETPEWLVDEMIECSITALNVTAINAAKLNQVRWLDPCCGAGAFVVGLIRNYLKRTGTEARVTDLPLITAIDLMPDALEATRVGVAELLGHHGLSVNDYLSSGRLVLETRDFLSVARDSLTLTDAWHNDFDVAIGNPPYIRSRDWLPEQRASVKDAFPQLIRGGCDLYGYFYVAAMNVVRAGGVVSFVTPFSFLRVSSASEVRTRLNSNSRLRLVLDLGETAVFDGVDLHAGVFVLRRELGDQRAQWGTLSSGTNADQRAKPKIHWARGYVVQNAVGGWRFTSDSSPHVDRGRTLKTMSECGIRIYSGIRPGVAEAFLLSEEQRSGFRDAKSMNFIRPVITAREIVPWESKSHRYWVIDSRADEHDLGDELMEHLGQFREALETRSEVGKTAQWYQLRSCSYMDVMAREKIAFPDISKQQRFSIVPHEMLVLDGAFFLDSSRPALLGILNSSLARKFFEANCPAIGTPGHGGRLRYKKSVLSKFPLPPSWLDGSTDLARLDDLVSEAIEGGEVGAETTAMIDDLVAAIYGSGFGD